MTATSGYRLARIVGGCLLACLALLFLAAGAAYFLLLQNPEKLLSGALREVEQATGLDFGMVSVQLSFSPWPAVAIAGLKISGDQLEFSSPWLTVTPNFLLLLRGELAPARITALKPRLECKTGLPLLHPGKLAGQLREFVSAHAEGDSQWRKIFSQGCALEVERGQAIIMGGDTVEISLSDLDCRISLDDETAAGEIKFAALNFRGAGKPVASLNSFQIQGSLNLTSPVAPGNKFALAGRLEFPGYLYSTQIKVDYESDASGWLSHVDMGGDLDLPGARQPWSLNGVCVNFRDTAAIAVRQLEWSLGADNGTLDATFIPPAGDGNFSVQGVFYARRLSLTQWFGFARNLAPGLQLSLDNVRNARLAFNLTPRALNVPFIRATCSGAKFSGSGGVADFLKPVVALDLKSDQANLGLALGEALGKSPLPPHFDHPPLTPMPGEPLKPGETGIGYDIRLGAANLLYGPLTIKNAALRIYPGKLNKDGLEDVLLAASAKFYGGEFKGTCVLGAPASLPISINASCGPINARQISADMPALPLRKGNFQVSAQITSQGKELKPFLHNLKGQINLAGSNAAFRAPADLDLAKLGLAVSLRSASQDKKRVGFDGKWRVSCSLPFLTGEGTIDGKIWFGFGGASFRNLPAHISASLTENFGFLRAGEKLAAQGSLSGDSGGEQFSLAQARASLGSISLDGNLHIDGAREVCSGSFKTGKLDLAAIFRKFGQPPPALRELRLGADFSVNAGQIALTKINASLGGSQIGGSLAWQNKNVPSLTFSLDVDKFDLERALPTGAKTSGARGAPLNFPLLKAFNAQGELRVKSLTGWKTRLENAKIPLRLHDGSLVVDAISGIFYGANLRASGTAVFRDGVQFEARTDVKSFDLGACARPMLNNAVLEGRASVEMSGKAHLKNTSQFPAALNGSWDLRINNGRWQNKNKKGELSGKPTIFDSVRASGRIENGVVKSGNLSMRGPDLNVSGGGSLNLASRKIDCKLDVSMKGYPDFPLTLYGTLDKPKTSIGAGKLVLNALGEIAGGIGDALGGIMETVWKVFR